MPARNIKHFVAKLTIYFSKKYLGLKQQLFILRDWEAAAGDHVEDGDHGEDHEDHQGRLAKLHQEIHIVLVSWEFQLNICNPRNLCTNLGTSRILQKRREGCCCRWRSCCCRCCPGEEPEAPRTLMTEESSKTFSGDRVNSSVTWSQEACDRVWLGIHWAGERRIGRVRVMTNTWHNHTGTPGHTSQRCCSYVQKSKNKQTKVLHTVMVFSGFLE